MMIDLVSPDFWPIIPLAPHWGVSHFIWRFMDPHRSARSLSFTGYSLRRGHGRYLTGPLRSIQLVPHFSTLGCHHASPSGRSSWIYVHDSVMDDQYYMFDDRWLHVMLFFRPVAHLMPYWGMFFPFRMRFTDLHRGHVLDDRWFHVGRFLTYRASDAHTGAYFPFQMRFMGLHLCHMIDDRRLRVSRFPTCRASDAHIGAYFPF